MGEAVVLCGEFMEFCICTKAKDHEGYHECTRDNCGGQWLEDENGQFHIGRMPGGMWDDLVPGFMR